MLKENIPHPCFSMLAGELQHCLRIWIYNSADCLVTESVRERENVNIPPIEFGIAMGINLHWLLIA